MDDDQLYCVECEEDLPLTRGQAEELQVDVYACPSCRHELDVHELTRMLVGRSGVDPRATA